MENCEQEADQQTAPKEPEHPLLRRREILDFHILRFARFEPRMRAIPFQRMKPDEIFRPDAGRIFPQKNRTKGNHHGS
jgi:hypothetical protein